MFPRKCSLVSLDIVCVLNNATVYKPINIELKPTYIGVFSLRYCAISVSLFNDCDEILCMFVILLIDNSN